MHVLLVEDDPLVGDGIAVGLRLYGFVVTHVTSASSAQSVVRSSHVDICVLDLGLPDTDGLQVLSEWRSNRVNLPVIALTARDAVKHKIAGLRAGADDYMTKPFELEELIARLQTLLRRASGQSSDRYQWGTLTLIPAVGETYVDDKPVSLSRREFLLLNTLLQYPHRILSATQLQDSIYGYDVNVESNALNVHIHHLRRKLGTQIIETVRGVGYRLGHLDLPA